MPPPTISNTLWRSLKPTMSSPSSQSQILEGVFAIAKPPSITSAQVIRSVQSHFDPSRLFSPWLQREKSRLESEHANQKSKRKWRGRRATSIKMGHGGTLDPMATGVLILGVGAGTKKLGHYTTGCTKSYETVVLFGAGTDTYDVEGKVVARKAFEHVTREMVEKALEAYRGKILQKPPIYSALKVQGKKMYEYAREGKELPTEIKEREVEVLELECLEWMQGGEHEYRWPEEEVEGEEKVVVEKLLGVSEGVKTDVNGGGAAAGQKREREQDSEENPPPSSPPPSKRPKTDDRPASPTKSKKYYSAPPPTDRTLRPRCPAPAVRLRMTVTSGFYVRSLCHDLGVAVDSLGTMASLVRTRQGEFELGRNVLEYSDLEKGEEVWGGKVREMLGGVKEVEVGEEGEKDEVKEEVVEMSSEVRSGEGMQNSQAPDVKAEEAVEQISRKTAAESDAKVESEAAETAEGPAGNEDAKSTS